MAKYIDDKGLKRFAGNVDTQINNARYSVLNTKGKPNGIASLDSKGFVPLAQLGNLDMDFLSVVTELPTTDIKKHIYLIKNNKEGEQDTYDEYLYTGDVDGEYDASKWEKLGDFVPTFDLKEYAKKGEGLSAIKIIQDTDESCNISLTMSDGSTKEVDMPLACSFLHTAWEDDTIISTQEVKPMPMIRAFRNGAMSGQDKYKLDQIDLEALSQSISNANGAADRVDASIRSCEAATAGAETVDARLTEDNVVEITDRNGTTKSVSLDGAVKAGSDIARIKESLGSYTERPTITLKATKTNKAISADGVEIAKNGWNIAEFTAEPGNEYLFKPGVIDSNVCIFAECIDKIEVRAIDYQYTYNEDGNIAMATATYNGKTYTYSYDYSDSDVVITDANGNKVPSIPTVYTTTIGSYNVLTRLNADAELPEDGYCRFVSNFQSASSIKVAVSCKADSADLNMRVVRDGMTASMCTQLSKINKKVDEIAGNQPSMTIDMCFCGNISLVVDGKVIDYEPYKNYHLKDVHTLSVSNKNTLGEYIKIGYGKVERFNIKYYKAKNTLTNLELLEFYSTNGDYYEAYPFSSLKSFDVSGFDTSRMTSLNSLFYNMTELKELDVSSWDTSNVNNMYRVFQNCKSLMYLDLRSWSFKKVSTITGIFQNCISLKTLDIRGLDFGNIVHAEYIFGVTTRDGLISLENFYVGEGLGKIKKTAVENGVLNLSSMSKWTNDTVNTLLNLYDRTKSDLGTLCIKLSSATKTALGEENMATLTSKGYIIL